MQKIYIASDHAAFKEKAELIDYLKSNYKVIDLGTNDSTSVNYSDFGKKLAKEVISNDSIGIAICGSGIGISMAVNRFKGIRGALCRDIEDAKMSKLHNNANIICFGSRRNSVDEIKAMTDTWLEIEFEGGRHQKRIDILDED
jgi:ribose 5-phosphate isomerase B